MSRLTKLLGVKPAAPAASDASTSSSGAGTGNIGLGVEVAFTLAVFLGIGVLLDNWLRTRPLFIIVMVVLALVGQFAKLWYEYDAKMKLLADQRRRESLNVSPPDPT